MKRVGWITAMCLLLFVCAGTMGRPGKVRCGTSGDHAVGTPDELQQGGGPVQLAARYHLRTRTKGFFERAVRPPWRVERAPAQSRPAAGPPVRERARPTVGEPATPSATQHMAARYHLRTRTRSFFARAVG